MLESWVRRKSPAQFGGGQSKKGQQSHLVGWLPYGHDGLDALVAGWGGPALA